MTAMSIKESEAYHLFPVFLFSSFSSVSKCQRLELPFIFNKSPACFVLRDFNEYSCCFFKCYATKQDLFKLGWCIVGKHKQQNVSNNVFKALYFEEWPSYLGLNNRNATRTPRII